MLSYEVRCSSNSWVSHSGRVVVLANQLSSLHRVSGHDFTIVLPPFSLYLHKVMGIYPRFEGSFVLGWYRGESSYKEFFGEDDDILVVAFPLIIVSAPR